MKRAGIAFVAVLVLVLGILSFIFRLKLLAMIGLGKPPTVHDTPIVIAGGSIHATTCVDGPSDTGCTPSGWVIDQSQSTIYTVKPDNPITSMVVKDRSPAGKEIQRYSLSSSVPWSVEITQIDTSDPNNPVSTGKAIAISYPLVTTSGTDYSTVTISITNPPTKDARWDSNGPSELDFRGNPKACKPDSDPSDPLGHCDRLSSLQLLINGKPPVINGKPQGSVSCETSPGDGKCFIEFHTK